MAASLGDREYDAVVVGSGFGGVMAAYPLVMAGERVLMLERGDWVTRGPHNWDPRTSYALSPDYCPDTPYLLDDGRKSGTTGTFHCVGGPSVYYGGVALRLREQDFSDLTPAPGETQPEWPFGYRDLAPFYDRAEQLLGVAGDDSDDPTAPPRATPYPFPPAALTPPSQRIADAARRLGLRPVRLPLAINHAPSAARRACAVCATCDGFPCAISAKNDLATGLIPALQAAGLELRANSVVVGLDVNGRRVQSVRCVDRKSGEQHTVRADRVIIAAGALATPHLLLASGVARFSPAPQAIGRYLMRHNNFLTLGAFPHRTNPGSVFHKQIAIHDYYLGDPGGDASFGKVGAMQQITTPAPSFVRSFVRAPLGHVAALGTDHVLVLLCIAEDQPMAANRVWIDNAHHDRFGVPRLSIHHRYTPRDTVAGRTLVRHARRILREAGAWFSIVHHIRTFSHAVGTVRMGRDPATSPVDDVGRFRGLDNLFITDGSVLPTSGSVNPSLTIAANALRVGALLANSAPRVAFANASRSVVQAGQHAV